MPTPGQRTSLSLAIPDDASDNEAGVIKCSAVSMCQRITEFPAFMNRPRCFRRGVTGDASRERKLFEEPFYSALILRDVRIELGISPFQVGVGYDPRPAVAGTSDEDHIQVVLLDQAVQMHINKVQTWCRAPMAQQSRFDVFDPQRLLQQRVVVQIYLADR